MTVDIVEEEEIQIDWTQVDFSDLEEKFKVVEEDPLESVVIIDNTPAVDVAKKEKLLVVLKKKFKEAGCGTIKDVHFPEKDGKLKGYIFMTFENAEDAKEAMAKMNGFAFDKNHTFSVTKFNDFESMLSINDEYVPPKKEEFKETEDLSWWLLDSRDQIITLSSDEVAVLWNNGKQPPEMIYKKQNWTDSVLQWSTYGTYLCTFHKQGVAIWGGKSWQRISRFVHQHVVKADFSPCEQYLVTWSLQSASSGPKEEHLRIWDVSTGKLLRGFATPEIKSIDDLKWPLFKWSHDEKYVGRLGKDSLYIYELPEMTLLDNKSVKVESIKDFCWAPKENLLAYWSPELTNTPARVSLISIPSKELVRSKNLVLVADCDLSFDSNEGDFLCAKIERYTKTKKSKFSSLEMFFLREKDIPIDTFEEFKDKTVLSIKWEPKGDRVAALCASDNNLKTFVIIFKVEKSNIKEVRTLERKSVTNLFWNPNGRFIIFANLNGGDLEFFDAEDMVTTGTNEHYQATEVEWDPSGRFAISSSSFYKYQGENGIMMWDFKGELLLKKNLMKLKFSAWRPRPPTLLSKEQMKDIRRNLSKHAKEFEEADSKLSGDVKQKMEAKRSEILKTWREWLQKKHEDHEMERDERAKLRGSTEEPVYSDNEADDEEIEEWIEEIIEESEEIVKDVEAEE